MGRAKWQARHEPDAHPAGGGSCVLSSTPVAIQARNHLSRYSGQVCDLRERELLII